MSFRDPDTAARFSIGVLIKLVRALRWQHQLFVFLVLLQCVYLIIDRIVQLALFTDWGGGLSSTRAAIWFCGIVIVAAVFVAYYAIHAILTVNLIELIVFRVLTVWLLVRCIVGYATSSGDCSAAARSTCLGFLVVEVVINLATFALSVSAIEDLRWKRYKAVGAEVQVRALYRRYELFSAFRKIDVQFSIVTLYTGILYTATSLDSNRTAQFALGASVALVRGAYRLQRGWPPRTVPSPPPPRRSRSRSSGTTLRRPRCASRTRTTSTRSGPSPSSSRCSSAR